MLGIRFATAQGFGEAGHRYFKVSFVNARGLDQVQGKDAKGVPTALLLKDCTLVPATGSRMTANDAPSPFVASASGENGGSNPAYRMYSDTTGYWQHSSSETQMTTWTILDCGAKKLVCGIQLQATYFQLSNVRLLIEGSNTGSFGGEQETVYDTGTFTRLDSSGGVWAALLVPPTSGTYRYFRYVFEKSAADGQVGISGNDNNYASGLIDAKGNCLPISRMTGSNAPSPYVASASSQSANAYRAFGVNWDYWRSDASDLHPWLQLDYGSAIAISGIRLNATYGGAVTRVSLYGSNTGAFAGEETLLVDSAPPGGNQFILLPRLCT